VCALRSEGELMLQPRDGCCVLSKSDATVRAQGLDEFTAR
jgi:hypothetical protein